MEQTREILLGNEAIARGAYEAGVRVVSSYPGTPSTEITEAAAGYEAITTEWAVNEKVGMEVAVGASIAGVRAMTCMKHVGLNVAADPLFTASYTGVNGGLVVVVADDPGMHSSQNEQDSRHYARAAKLPMLEPSDSGECRDYVGHALDLSEQYDTPVLIRLSTRISHSRSPVTLQDPVAVESKPYVKDRDKYVMMPAMARGRHVHVEERMARLGADTDRIGLNRVEPRSRSLGIVTSGIAYQYVMEAVPDASVFKIGRVWPLPVEEIRRFAATVDRLVVVEELDPFIETELRAAGIPCEGKELFSLTGEYSAAMVRRALGDTEAPQRGILCDGLPDAPNRPPVLCAGCPHRGLFFALSRLNAVVMGDIGCYTLGALPPMNAMDTCVCMGASVGMAHGADRATDGDLSRRTVAVLGDSTFIHSGITGLIHAVYNRSAATVVILDNSITGMTGHQQNPATGRDIHLQPAPALDLEQLCRAVGVGRIQVVDPADIAACRRVLKEEMDAQEVSVVIARRPCALIPTGRSSGWVEADQDICTRCGACIRLRCPALTEGADGFPVVDPDTCNQCGLCVRVCPVGAFKEVAPDEA